MRYVQQSHDVETIRIVQRPNDPKRKLNGGTMETVGQEILQSEKEGSEWQIRIQAAGSRFVSWQWAAGLCLDSEQQVRVQVAAASSCPGSRQRASSLCPGRFAEIGRRQRGPVHSVLSTRASYSAK